MCHFGSQANSDSLPSEKRTTVRITLGACNRFQNSLGLLVSNSRALVIAMSLLLFVGFAQADYPGVESEIRAKTNYMLYCQGCHGPDGRGTTDNEVPNLNGFMGHFLAIEGGREFLVQVPGSALSQLSDGLLAELLNWLLVTVSMSEIPDGFVPYEELEVRQMRQNPVADPVRQRVALVSLIKARMESLDKSNHGKKCAHLTIRHKAGC